MKGNPDQRSEGAQTTMMPSSNKNAGPATKGITRNAGTRNSEERPRTESPADNSEYETLRQATARRQHRDALRYTELQAQEEASWRRQEKARALAQALEDEEREMRMLAKKKVRLMGVYQGMDETNEQHDNK
jgi:hypothetical protein